MSIFYQTAEDYNCNYASWTRIVSKEPKQSSGRLKVGQKSNKLFLGAKLPYSCKPNPSAFYEVLKQRVGQFPGNTLWV